MADDPPVQRKAVAVEYDLPAELDPALQATLGRADAKLFTIRLEDGSQVDAVALWLRRYFERNRGVVNLLIAPSTTITLVPEGFQDGSESPGG